MTTSQNRRTADALQSPDNHATSTASTATAARSSARSKMSALRRLGSAWALFLLWSKKLMSDGLLAIRYNPATKIWRWRCPSCGGGLMATSGILGTVMDASRTKLAQVICHKGVYHTLGDYRIVETDEKF
jgi:hypothetical protein